MEELKIYDFSTAVALLAYGIPFSFVKNDEQGKLYFSFQPLVNAQNILTLYKKQQAFLNDKVEKYKYLMSTKIRGKKTKFGAVNEVYRDSTRKTKGMARKSNGIWKSM